MLKNNGSLYWTLAYRWQMPYGYLRFAIQVARKSLPKQHWGHKGGKIRTCGFKPMIFALVYYFSFSLLLAFWCFLENFVVFRGYFCTFGLAKLANQPTTSPKLTNKLVNHGYSKNEFCIIRQQNSLIFITSAYD